MIVSVAGVGPCKPHPHHDSAGKVLEELIENLRTARTACMSILSLHIYVPRH
jgi:hypothetical protein